MVKSNNGKQKRLAPIRITKNDIAEHARLVRNAKAKIKRTSKKYGIDLSGEIKLPELESFKTRKEFNQFKDSVKKFTNRANTKYQFKKNRFGVVKSVKEINEIKKATKQAQKVTKKILKDNEGKEFTSGGIVTGTVAERNKMLAKPNTAGIYVPPDFNFENVTSDKHFEQKLDVAKEKGDPEFVDKRKEQLLKNYIKAVEEEFNSLADPIVESVKDIDPNDFYELYITRDELQHHFVYTEEDVENYAEQIKNIIDSYKAGLISMDLKNF